MWGGRNSPYDPKNETPGFYVSRQDGRALIVWRGACSTAGRGAPHPALSPAGPCRSRRAYRW